MTKTSNQYTCVSCDFYDQLEIFAMMKILVKIKYQDERANENILISEIKNLKTENKEEFIITSSGFEIRLDRILDITKYKR